MSDKWRVLYVDDEPQWVELAKDSLSEDWDLTIASSIREVTQYIQDQRNFDIAIVDLGIGGGNLESKWDPKSGEEIARKLSEYGVKIGFLSAMDSVVSHKIANDLHAPLFDKGHIDSLREVAETTLHFGAQENSERKG